MSGGPIEINIAPSVVVVLLAIALLLVFLFGGEPDVHDALVKYLMTAGGK